jgi:hypothetical protein
MGEDHYQLCITQGTDNQSIRELKKLNFQKINYSIKKWAKHLNRAFSKKDVQMAKKHMEKCSPFLTVP